MPPEPKLKFIARNVAALRKGQDAASAGLIAGNSEATRLESGVGNCFPGLECDLRNLERRFFPFLEVEMIDTQMRIGSVDTAGVQAASSSGALSAQMAQAYATVANTLNGFNWRIQQIAGVFGPLGQLTINPGNLGGQSLGPGRLPSDAWTAVRLLTEDSVVTLIVARVDGAGATVQLRGQRARYLDDNGALARMFEPGELTQSLCSPWTHDFRDCGCYYWASNHPDIALPPTPAPEPQPLAPKWNLQTPWERSSRNVATPPVANGTSPGALEMRYHEINRDWQRLNFVLERRERMTVYVPEFVPRMPLANQQALIAHLRYAAGVELAVMQEYLSAAYSLARPTPAQSAMLRGDLRAAFSEVLRIAIGEMRHIRMVNDVLRLAIPVGPFAPALAVASRIPSGHAGVFRNVQFRAATPAALDDFLAIEAPSLAVDGLYGRILATLEQNPATEESQQLIRTVMAEGDDHFQTFGFIKEWLGRHSPAEILRSTNLVRPPAGNAAHAALQQRYAALLQALHEGYRLGLPSGAANINQARTSMLGNNGIEGALEAVAALPFLVVFDGLQDPRFSAIDPPN